MTLKMLSLNVFFISTIFISSHQEAFASMKNSENSEEINTCFLSKSQESTDDPSSDDCSSLSTSSDSKGSDSLMLLPLTVKELKKDLCEVKSSLKIEGEISREDILSLKDGKYTSIFLQGAYSYEQSDSLKNNYFIISTLTFYTGIQELTLRACSLTNDHLVDIKSLKNLEILKLPSNLISQDGVECLTELAQLRILDLSCNYLNDECIAILSNLRQLEDFYVKSNKGITDISLEIISKYSCLKNVNLAMSGISIKKFSEFKRTYKGLIKFNYSLR